MTYEVTKSTAGSDTTYFNPKTQRYHDSETKRMVKTSSALGAKALDKGTGSSLGGIEIVKPIFTSMMRTLIGIEAILMKMWGIAEADRRAEGVAARFAAGETDAPPDDGDDKKGPGFFGKMKGMFGKGWGAVKAMPNWLKTLGLGALLFWLSKNRDTFAKMIVPLLEWIKKTVDYLSGATWPELKDDFKDKIIQPSLGVLGLRLNEAGEIERIPHGWLDMVTFWSGPTNIFKTLGALWRGQNPDTGEWFIPEWMRPWEEQEWVKKITEQREKEGKWKTNMFHVITSLWKGVSPTTGDKFLPEWMYADVTEMQWFKDTTEWISKLPGDPAGTIKSLWEGKNPKTGESFLPEWMTKPINETQWFKDTQKYLKEFGETFQGDPVETLKAIWQGKDPVSGESFLPDWMTKPINETQWFKDTKKYLTNFKDTFQGDPAGTLKALWEGKDPVSGESFLPTWMTDPSVLATNIKLMFKALLPAWMTDDKKDLNLKLKELDKTLGLPTQDEIEKALKDMMKMIYDPVTGAVFGIDFKNLKNMLPSLQDIATSIVSSLPKWMRPDTLLEQVADAKAAIKLQRADAALYPEDKGIARTLEKMELDLQALEAELESKFPGLKTSSAASYAPSTTQLAWLQKSRAPGDKLMQLKSVTTGDNAANGPVVIVNKRDGDNTKVDATVTTIALSVDNSEMSQRFYGQDKFFPVATAV